MGIAQEDLEIISLIEKTHLERIKKDRNICSHPSFSDDGVQFVPQPEMARSHIVQAANYLLIQAPIKGKVFLDNLYNLITGNSFPEDPEKAFEVLKSDQFLGRIKDSVIRNLVIILFKRLFIDEQSVSSSLMKKATSALVAINRINHVEYENVCSENLTRILANSNDDKIKRIIPALAYRASLWIYLDESVKHRIEQTLENMGVSEIIKYQATHAAEFISEINGYLQSSINDIEGEELKMLLKEAPSVVLIDKAINLFVESDSFSSAYNNGVHILLNYADYITDIKLLEIFEGAKNNSRYYNINQILSAGGISEFFVMLYKQTKTKNVREHAKLWVNFRNEVNALKHNYEDLDSIMEIDGIIKTEEVDQEKS